MTNADISGKTFGNLKVLKKYVERSYGRSSIVYLCKCLKCGKNKKLLAYKIPKLIDCGCGGNERKSLGKIKDITGEVFGRLTVISFSHMDRRMAIWNCECECGNTCKVSGVYLRGGGTKSCGCLKKENNGMRTHGLSSTKIHKIWVAMMQRCYNKRSGAYNYYGGRGVVVCKRWHKFENFYADMGERPKNRTLDRINNDGNYEPKNCRWATQVQQDFNKRSSVMLWYKEKYMTFMKATIKSGLPVGLVLTRRENGVPASKLFEPFGSF